MFPIIFLCAAAGGYFLTYLYDRSTPLSVRLSAGVCTGLTLFGLICFVLASLLGLGAASIALATAAVAAPALLLIGARMRTAVGSDWRTAFRGAVRAVHHPSWRRVALLLLYFAAVIVFWHVFDRAMIVRNRAIYTGVENNLGDLPLHTSIIQSFATGDNFPPEHSEFAGARLTYPFLADFIAAVFVAAGASLRDAMFWENLALGAALVVLLHFWAQRWTGDALAAALTPALVLLNGGLGWTWLIAEAQQAKGGWRALLWNLPHDYTITPDGLIRWGNAITALLVTQRSFLLGLPLVIIVLTLWWNALDEEGPPPSNKQRGTKKRQERESDQTADVRRMAAAGAIAGLLPLAHAHSFLVVAGASTVLALLSRRWRLWFPFFIAMAALALPQILWITRGSAIETERFIGWAFGWDSRGQNLIFFWLKNTGAFIPLLVAALLWRGSRPLLAKKLLVFYLPFGFCFIIPNMIKLAPWIWDNIKILFYWYVASVPIVALLLARLWCARFWWRPLVVVLFVSMTLAGALDVWRIVSRAPEFLLFDAAKTEFARLIEETVPPRSVILHAPTYNHAVRLTGRLSFMGFEGHLWTHGLKYEGRDDALRRIYSTPHEGRALLRRERIDYVVAGPEERELMPHGDWFATEYELVGESDGYRLYKVAP